VIKGTKWAGVKWIHAAPFGGGYPQQPLATAGASLAQAERLLAQKLVSCWRATENGCGGCMSGGRER